MLFFRTFYVTKVLKYHKSWISKISQIVDLYKGGFSWYDSFFAGSSVLVLVPNSRRAEFKPSYSLFVFLQSSKAR